MKFINAKCKIFFSIYIFFYIFRYRSTIYLDEMRMLVREPRQYNKYIYKILMMVKNKNNNNNNIYALIINIYKLIIHLIIKCVFFIRNKYIIIIMIKEG